jgi:outer membrane protein assembly factor BamB
MTIAQGDEPTPRKPLRLWPGVVAAALLCVVRFVVPVVEPEAVRFGLIGGLFVALAVVLWWAFLSRAPWFDRLGAILLMIAALAATPYILHKSIATGMMGLLFFIYAIPALSLAFVVWAVACRRLPDVPRRASMVATILLACGAWALVRTGGITGEADSDFHWRWSQTPEERLLAQSRNEPVVLPPTSSAPETPKEQPVAKADDKPVALRPAPAATKIPEKPRAAKGGDAPAALPSAPPGAKTEADWPGFRGPGRDGVVRGVRIETDWVASPPVRLWRRPIGPGWSSFAVRGDFFYTQEQRGDDEVVACYKVSTGEAVWRHRDAARFWESNGGAGPRATPTLSNGRVYTFGATGILNALDAGNGAVVWSRTPPSDTGRKIPGWGFASSPLVVDDVVIVAAASALVAYDVATGNRRWLGPSGGWGYSSPHLVTIDGVAQVLLLNGAGVISVAPADGRVLWEHRWPSDGIVQPALTANGNVLIGSGSGISPATGIGVRRVAVTQGPGGWNVEERWTSNALKPYFNDFVVHKGHAYGFDGGLLASIDLEDGKRKWKGGRYGHGQLVLLHDQDLLLVLSEEGELALVEATPDRFRELARSPAIEGKTWNHPALVRDVLLARNGEEMVAFRLSLAKN